MSVRVEDENLSKVSARVSQRGRGRFPAKRRGMNRRKTNRKDGQKLLSELPKYDLLKIHTYQINKAGKEGNWRNVIRAYEWLKAWKVKPDKFVYNALISALCSTNPRKALEIYDEMLSGGFVPDATTYCGIISSHGKLGRWQNALDMFQEFLGSGSAEADPLGDFKGVRGKQFTARPLEVCYNSLISAYGMSKKWQKATELFAEMKQAGVGVTVVTYGALLLSYEKAGRRDDALRVMDEMVKDSIKANTIIYNTVMFACLAAKDWTMSLQLFDRMKSEGLACDEVTYLAVIQAASDARDWTLALEIAKQMKVQGVEPKVETFNALMHACVENYKWDIALNLLDIIETNHRKATENSTETSTLEASNDSFGQVTIAILGKNNSKAVIPDVISYNTCLNACVQMRDWRRAVELFQRMVNLGISPDVYSYNTLMKALGDAHKPIAAEQTFFELQERKDVSPDVVSYNTLIKAYGDAGDWISALDLYRDMRDYHPDVPADSFTYNQLLHLFDYAGQSDSALEIAEDMKKADISPDAFTLSILAASKTFENAVIAKALGINETGFEFKTLHEAAMDIMSQRQLGDISIQEPQILFNALISATKRDWQTALELLNTMASYSVQPDAVTFDAVINVYVRAGQWLKARQMLRKMQTMGITSNALTFSNVIGACVSNGQWQKTIRELERSQDSYRFNFLAHNVLMAAYSNAGNLMRALEIYQKMIEMKDPVNVIAYAAFLRACGRDSRWEDAVFIMQDMRENSVRPSSNIQNQLVLGMVYDGALAEAMNVLDMMSQDCAPVTAQTFKTVAGQLRQLAPDQFEFSTDFDSEEDGQYTEHLNRKLQLQELAPEQCAEIAQVMEDISLENPCKGPGADDEIEIWGGELETETEEDVTNFVNFVKAGWN